MKREFEKIQEQKSKVAWLRVIESMRVIPMQIVAKLTFLDHLDHNINAMARSFNIQNVGLHTWSVYGVNEGFHRLKKQLCKLAHLFYIYCCSLPLIHIIN